MNGLILAEYSNNKDIKLLNEKKTDIKSSNNKNEFDDLIFNFLKIDENENSSNFLLSKILNTTQNSEDDIKILSTYSKSEFLTEDDLQKVALEDMIKLSFLAKNGVVISDFKTDSKTLKKAISTDEFINSLKKVTDIKSLVDLAQKYDIKIKNIEFVKADNIFNDKDKIVSRKIASEEVFSIIDKKLSINDKKKYVNEISSKNKIENFDINKPVLEQLLSKKSSKKNSTIFSLEKEKITKTKIENKEFISVKEEIIDNKKIKKNLNQHNSSKNISKFNTKKYSHLEKEQSVITPTKSHDKNGDKINDNLKVKDSASTQIKIEPKNSFAQEILLDTKDKKNLKNSKLTHNVSKQIEKDVVVNKIITDEINNQKSLQQSSSKNKYIDKKMDFLNLEKEEHSVFKENQNKYKKQTSKVKEVDLKIAEKNNKELLPTTKNKDILKNILNNTDSNNTKNINSLSLQKDHLSTIQINKESVLFKSREFQKFSKIQTDINFKTLKKEQQQIVKTQTQITSTNTTNMDKYSAKIEQDNQESRVINDNSTEKNITHYDHKLSQVDREKQPVEVKKTFSSFAQEFKEKVESYKAPLMKVKMQLNPSNLGEVDVTLLNRGKNLHISISSNSTNMAIFMQNQAEFRNSLINMGFTNLQMNFNDKQDQNRQENSRNNNKNNLKYDDNKEDSESIEILMPYYI